VAEELAGVTDWSSRRQRAIMFARLNRHRHGSSGLLTLSRVPFQLTPLDLMDRPALAHP
jgi:hypothetical protein